MKEMKDKEIREKWSYTLTEAKKAGIEFSIPPPPPPYITCFHCKKDTEPIGMLHPFENRIWLWCDASCNCTRALEEKEKEEKKTEEEEKDRIMREKINKLFSQSNIEERFRSRTFENFTITDDNRSAYKKARHYAEVFEEFKRTGTGIFFTGTVGTGKTHLAVSIANLLINRQIPVIFGTSIKLLSRIKQTYGNNQEEENKIISLYSNVNLLVIDDLGKEKPSFWVLEKIYEIINNRYEAMKPMVITSNFSLNAIGERFSSIDEWIAKAICSRISEQCSNVEINGQDWRMK